MKSKKLWLGIGAAVLIVLCMGVAFLATQGKTDYYTQIDNRWVTEIAPHGAMNYEYNLDPYPTATLLSAYNFVGIKKFIKKVVPIPNSLSTSIVPLCASIIAFASGKPRPIPWVSFENRLR